MSKTLKLVMAVIFGVLFGPAFAGAPATLTINDLRNNPERWPAAVTVPKDIKFQGGASAKKGQVVKVVELNGAEVVVDAGNGLVFDLPIAETDLVARANEVWTKLTPEQREITVATLVKDRALWPLSVKCSDEFEFQDGTVLKPGGEYELISVGRDEITLYSPKLRSSLGARVQSTDLIERARALVLIPAEQRPSRIAAALKGKLVNAAGKPADPANLEDTQVFALYYGASWCGPCRKFSPDLVKFVQRVGAENPKLTVVLMSNDKADAEMYGYMNEEKMPWTALPLAQLNLQPALTAYVKGGIPQLVIVDRQGKILADSYRGSSYIGPMPAMQQLEKILGTGAAK